MVPSYESVFGLVERPFSLAPDPRWFYADGSHGRALEAVMAGLDRREPFVLVTGDLGVGKTLLGRVLLARQKDSGPTCFVSNPLLPPEGLVALLADDFGGLLPLTVGLADPHRLIADAVRVHAGAGVHAVLVVDDAHRLPQTLRDLLLDLVTPEPGEERALRVVLLAQPSAHVPLTLGSAIDERIRTRVRLGSLSRDESADYVAHRLRLAGARATPDFSSRALDVLFGLSNGLPRLVNLLCERALHEAAAQGHQTIEPGHIAAAASAFKLTHARPRRFRWFNRKTS